jgi:hypothetical protein
MSLGAARAKLPGRCGLARSVMIVTKCLGPCAPWAAAQMRASRVDVCSHVALLGDGRVTGVEAHAHLHLCALGPGVIREGL